MTPDELRNLWKLPESELPASIDTNQLRFLGRKAPGHRGGADYICYGGRTCNTQGQRGHPDALYHELK